MGTVETAVTPACWPVIFAAAWAAAAAAAAAVSLVCRGRICLYLSMSLRRKTYLQFLHELHAEGFSKVHLGQFFFPRLPDLLTFSFFSRKTWGHFGHLARAAAIVFWHDGHCFVPGIRDGFL